MGREALTGPATSYIAGALLERKEQLGLSVDDIAARSGVSRSTVHRALHGSTSLSVEALLPICDALGVSPSVLISAAAQCRRAGVEPAGCGS